MIEMDSDHYQVVAESLTGQRKVDDRTFESLAVLSERLESVRGLDEAFAGIEFSPDVVQLQGLRRTASVV
jgi:hypothetical protein